MAKIAFNYFAYCAKESNQRGILFRPAFNRIREYILEDKSKLEAVTIDEQKQAILYNERNSQRRVAAHIATFKRKGNRIISEITILNQIIYRVDLGLYPFRIDFPGFGCGHLFEPFGGKILRLGLSPIPVIRTNEFSLTCH